MRPKKTVLWGGLLALAGLTGLTGCATELLTTIPNHPANVTKLARGAQRLGCQVHPLGPVGFVAECGPGKVDVPPAQRLPNLVVRCKHGLRPLDLCTDMVNRIAAAGAQ